MYLLYPNDIHSLKTHISFIILYIYIDMFIRTSWQRTFSKSIKETKKYARYITTLYFQHINFYIVLFYVVVLYIYSFLCTFSMGLLYIRILIYVYVILQIHSLLHKLKSTVIKSNVAHTKFTLLCLPFKEHYIILYLFCRRRRHHRCFVWWHAALEQRYFICAIFFPVVYIQKFLHVPNTLKFSIYIQLRQVLNNMKWKRKIQLRNIFIFFIIILF